MLMEKHQYHWKVFHLNSMIIVSDRVKDLPSRGSPFSIEWTWTNSLDQLSSTDIDVSLRLRCKKQGKQQTTAYRYKSKINLWFVVTETFSIVFFPCKLQNFPKCGQKIWNGLWVKIRKLCYHFNLCSGCKGHSSMSCNIGNRQTYTS